MKQRLDSQGMLTVLAEQGSINKVTCSFNPPLESEKLRDYEKSSAWSFPEDFKAFLKLHNGARIFDMVLGDTNIGGGLELYSIDEIQKVYENLQLDSFYYPIGYVLESHLFISKEAIDQENPNYLYIA
ncbi:SMI1/KNR4 family protein, partial [Streptomyces tendae]|uniref:SMI1/KNR4 family protein n=1 Tax=Streptomyces tendae TaxID=1932 RepID=UPI0036B0CEB7